MILSILATVAVLAAIATIAAALLLAETTLVYIALGLGGISVLLLSAALIQGGIRGAGQVRTRTGTDGLGKSSVPAVATTAATPPGMHSEPEESGRVPAPAPEPVRDSVVSEHGSSGFTPVTGDWPESATGSPDPDPDPEPFDYRIPYQGRTEDHSWAATPSGHDTMEPAPEETDPFSDWAQTRADDPDAAESQDALHGEESSDDAEPDETPAFNYRVPTADAFDDAEPGEYEDAHETTEPDADGSVGFDEDRVEAHPEPAEALDTDEAVEQDEDTGAGAFSYRVPTADAVEPTGSGADESPAFSDQEPDAVADERTEPAEVSDANGPIESEADVDEAESFTYRLPSTDADEPVEAGADEVSVSDEPTGFAEASEEDEPAAVSGTDEVVEAVETEGDADETAAFSYRLPSTDAVEPTGSGADESPAFSDQEPDADVDERPEPAEVSDADEPVEAEAFSYRVPSTDTDESAEAGADEVSVTDESAAFAEASDEDERPEVSGMDEAVETDADVDEAEAFSYRVPDTDEPAEADADDVSVTDESAAVSGTDEAVETEADPDETAAFSYRLPSTDTEGAPDAHGEGAAAFTYRLPVAEPEEDSAVAYAAILDDNDEPSLGDGSSRRQDPDQVS